MAENTPTDKQNEDISVNKDTAAASYTLLFAPILLVTRRDSEFIKFHAAQGLVLGILFLLLWWLGDYFSFFRYATIVVIFGAVIGFIQALGGHKYALPVISDLIKNGFSPRGIFQSLKKTFGFAGKIFVGTMPKKAGNIVEKAVLPAPIKQMEKRIIQLEKKVEELEKKTT